MFSPLRSLAFLLTILFALTSCAEPPQTMLVAPSPQAERVAVSLEPWEHLWPRIATTDGDYNSCESNMDHLRAVASSQVILWTLNWPDYHLNSCSQVEDPFGILRGMNPAIAIIGSTHSYLVPWSGCGSPAFRTLCAINTAVNENDWYVRDASGARLSTATGWWIDWAHGYAAWLTDFMTQVNDRQCAGRDCFDGYYVESTDIPHGIAGFVDADLNRDGERDVRPGGLSKCELDEMQLAGYARFMMGLGSRTGKPVGGGKFRAWD